MRDRAKGAVVASELHYRSLAHTFSTIVREEGFRGLYSGLLPNVIGNGVAWGVYMFLYQWLKGSTGHDAPSGMASLVLAMAAGAGTSVLTNPIWLVKVRLQSQPHDAVDKYRGVADAVRTILREEGLVGFWRGMVPALIGTSHGAVQMATYEQLRRWVWTKSDSPGPQHYLLLGIASKSIASVTTFPYQLVKTRMQVRDRHFVRHASLRQTVISVWRHEGLPGFYRGVVPATIRTAPQSAIMFATYEAVRSFLSDTKM